MKVIDFFLTKGFHRLGHLLQEDLLMFSHSSGSSSIGPEIVKTQAKGKLDDVKSQCGCV